MKITKPTEFDPHYYLYLNDKCFIHGHNDWSFIWANYNWYSFHFIHLYFENETMTGGWEFECMLLGLGFRIRYNYAFEESDAGKSLEEYKKQTNE
jgi:hypothetical protein